MNQKQFANVLLKILGIYFTVDGFIRLVTGVFSLFSALVNRGFGSSYIWITPVTGAILGVIGFLLIVLSKPIADALFKDE